MRCDVRIPDLQDRVALVTGASLGIGAGVARAFGQQRMKVAVHCNRSRAQAEQVAVAIREDGGQALVVQCDVRDTQAIAGCVSQVVDALGPVNVLVNNAGSLVRRTGLDALTTADFDEVLQVNARSAVCFAQAVLPAMREAAGGSIINVTSVSARTGGSPGASLYAASKGFVNTFTRALALELAAESIRVNGVAPGVILTPLQDRFSTTEMLERFKASIPMGRLGTVEDCVGAFLYLASPSLSGYMTGQILEINGGQFMA